MMQCFEEKWQDERATMVLMQARTSHNLRSAAGLAVGLGDNRVEKMETCKVGICLRPKYRGGRFGGGTVIML